MRLNWLNALRGGHGFKQGTRSKASVGKWLTRFSAEQLVNREVKVEGCPLGRAYGFSYDRGEVPDHCSV